MSAAPESLPSGLDEHTGLLTPDEVVKKFAAWEAGGLITSSMVQVGEIPPKATGTLLASRKILRAAYGVIPPDSWLRVSVADLEQNVTAIVRADMHQTGLVGDLAVVTRAGYYYDAIHREAWHSDNFAYPSVRWTAAFGVGSTRGAEGHVSRADTLANGDLNPDTSSWQSGRLRESHFPEGAVTRFMNSGDIHAGPCGDGARIMIQATLKLSV